MFYNDAKKEAIENLKKAQDEYSDIAQDAQDSAVELYEKRKSSARKIKDFERYINSLANTPKEFKAEIEKVLIEIKDFDYALEIEEQSSQGNIKGASLAGGGALTGGAIAALAPSAAMAIATTFGTASTGTAIASLSGAAATNAALAWLGGGAVAAGGGGMAAGNAFLALAGPVGWGIAGILAAGGASFAAYSNYKAAEAAKEAETKIDWEIYHLKKSIKKIAGLIDSTDELRNGIPLTAFNCYPQDYRQFNQYQKKNLLIAINNAKSLGVLINEHVN